MNNLKSFFDAERVRFSYERNRGLWVDDAIAMYHRIGDLVTDEDMFDHIVDFLHTQFDYLE